jgi:hypothetical protein
LVEKEVFVIKHDEQRNLRSSGVKIFYDKNGIITRRVIEWPKGFRGWLFERKTFVLPIDGLEEFADKEPEKFVDLAFNFWITRFNMFAYLKKSPPPSGLWFIFCDRVLEIARSRNITFVGMMG